MDDWIRFITLDPSRMFRANRLTRTEELLARRQERQMVESTWSSSAPVPVPLPGWVAQDTTTPAGAEKPWHPVVAIFISLRGELQVLVAPVDGRPRVLTNPPMHRDMQ